MPASCSNLSSCSGVKPPQRLAPADVRRNSLRQNAGLAGGCTCQPCVPMMPPGLPQDQRQEELALPDREDAFSALGRPPARSAGQPLIVMLCCSTARLATPSAIRAATAIALPSWNVTNGIVSFHTML